MHYGHKKEEYIMLKGQDKADLKLKCSNHVGKIAHKAKNILGFKRTFTLRAWIMFVPLYKTLIRPHLEYANCVWSPFLSKEYQKSIRRATKIIPSLTDCPYKYRSFERGKSIILGIQEILGRHDPNDMDKDYILFEMKDTSIDLMRA